MRAATTPAAATFTADPALRSSWAWAPPLLALMLLAAILATASDHALFLLLNHAGHTLGEGIWLQLTLLGDGAVALALVLPCVRRAPRCFWAGLVAAAVAAVWAQGIKHVVDVPRPLAVFAPGAFHHVGPGHRHGAFPSGHAAAAFALAGIWVMSLRGKAVRLALLVLAALVGLSRVMVGVHWPVDILGGMLGGWLGAWVGLAVAGRADWHERGRAGAVSGLLFGVVLLALSAALLVSRHVGAPVVLPLQRVIGAACLVVGAWDLAILFGARAWRPAHRARDG